MNGASDQLFAGAGLPQNADSRFAGRHALYLGHDAAHRVARQDDFMLPHAAPQLPVLFFQARELEHVVYCQE